MFTVNVRLVDKPVNSHAGNVKVAKAASQTNALGITFIIAKAALPVTVHPLWGSSEASAVSFAAWLETVAERDDCIKLLAMFVTCPDGY